MASTKTPVCDFGLQAPDFHLMGTDEKYYTLADCRGEKGLLVMFICNHCPYVQTILSRLADDVRELKAMGINCVGINANDAKAYPADSFEAMQTLAAQRHLPFPYLVDDTQEVAKDYQAVCTPDFFGYNADLELQYRGRFDDSGKATPRLESERDLLEAMRTIAETGKGPDAQQASIGCSIKWRVS